MESRTGFGPSPPLASPPDGDGTGQSHSAPAIAAFSHRTSNVHVLHATGAEATNASARLAGIEAARGVALVLVCVGHIKEYVAGSTPGLYEVLTAISRLAAPLFLLLSGLLIAHWLRHSAEPRVGVTLVDRGLFLLLVAPLVLGLAELSQTGVMDWLFGRASMTDAIALALCVAVAVRYASSGALLVGGFVLALLSWPIALWLAEGQPANLLAALLFAVRDPATANAWVPLMPYVGVFLIGMGLGTRFDAAIREPDGIVLAHAFLKIGLVAMAIVGGGVCAWFLLRDVAMSPLAAEHLREALDPSSHRPPGPAHLLFYGGIALCVTAVVLQSQRWRIGRSLIAPMSVLGRAALLCLVLQDWFLHLLPRLLDLDEIGRIAFWLPYLAATVGLLFFVSRKWNEVNGDRMLTVGLRALVPDRHELAPWYLPDTPARDAPPTTRARVRQHRRR